MNIWIYDGYTLENTEHLLRLIYYNSAWKLYYCKSVTSYSYTYLYNSHIYTKEDKK